MPHLKLLYITRNYPPLWGGMERLNWRMSQVLAETYDVHLIAPQGANAHVEKAITLTEVPLKPLWRFMLSALWQSLRQARRIKPTIILAGSGLTAPFAWLAARISRAKSVVYVHGLDVVAPHPIYRALWIPCLQRMDCVIANSRATALLAQQAGVHPQRLRIIHPGVDIPEHTSGSRQAFRARHGLGHVPVLLSVGRLTARKGLREFVSEVMPILVQQRPDICLVIVGDAATQALHTSAQTPHSIMLAAEKAGVGKHVRMIGTLFGQELFDAYAAADMHVFPVREIPNDPEGFGMVAIEAAAHGLPTVAYATGGVTDAVADGISGRLVPSGDEQAFAVAVLGVLQNPLEGDAVREFARGFDWAIFGQTLRKHLRDIK